MRYFDELIETMEIFFKETKATQTDLASASGLSRTRINAVFRRKVKNVQYKTWSGIMKGMKKIRKEKGLL